MFLPAGRASWDSDAISPVATGEGTRDIEFTRKLEAWRIIEIKRKGEETSYENAEESYATRGLHVLLTRC